MVGHAAIDVEGRLTDTRSDLGSAVGDWESIREKVRELAARAPGGWGLSMMRERAEAVGGRFSVEDAAPGTRITVTVPLRHADQHHPG